MKNMQKKNKLFSDERSKIILISCFAFLFSNPSISQKRITVSKPIEYKFQLKMAYLGSIVYPGLKVGVEFPVISKLTTVNKINKVKTKNKERFITANFGMYYHPRFHTNTWINAEWLMRKTRSNGWFTEWAPSMGYSRTFLPGYNYEVDNDGTISEKRFQGNNFIQLGISGGFGFDFSTKKWNNLKLYTKGTIMIFAPFNNVIYPRPSVEFGCIKRFNLKNKAK
jgi:hypothetical protein